MATDVLMPNLGFDTQFGRLIEWVRQPGDAVAKGDVLAIVESDKANVELEAVAAGILLEHCASPGDEVNVGAVIARIGGANEMVVPAALSDPAPPEARQTSTRRVSPVAQRLADDLKVPLEEVSGSGGRGRVLRRDVEAHRQPTGAHDGADARGIRALPAVRWAARERGIDLAAVRAAGYGNPVTLAALDAFAGRDTAQPVPATSHDTPGRRAIALSRMRQTIGRRLGESMRKAPHFYVTGEFVFDSALDALKHTLGGARITDLVAWLTVQALLAVPALNATFQDGTLYQHDGVHLALAVARDDGLLTPVLRDAGRFSLAGLAGELRGLVERARAGRLSPDALAGGTFTLSNLGMVKQVDHFTAVINPPQVAILAVGALRPRPVAIDGGLFVRQTAHLTLSGDHRFVDGMDLARFMAAFQAALDRFSA
jgi:pyruvate dehydrogenase E2 component (dihydrolipoamide acetyltransferase)